MADYLIHDSTLEDIADAIRAKTGGSALIDPEDMPTEIASIETGGGGIENGMEFITDEDNYVTEIRVRGKIIPNAGLNYWGWDLNINNANAVLPVVTFPDHPTHIGERFLHNAHILDLDFSTLDKVETIGGDYALSPAFGTENGWSSKIVNLPSYTGRQLNGRGSSNVFRGNSPYSAKKYICQSLELIPQYGWYQLAGTNIEIQLGSIGHAVQSSEQQPFGNTSNASGTITIYTTGALLDAVKTNAQASSGANLTFIYKASEATTYNDTSYNAGDTMMTSTGA